MSRANFDYVARKTQRCCSSIRSHEYVDPQSMVDDIACDCYSDVNYHVAVASGLASIAMYVYIKYAVFSSLACCSPADTVFLALSAAGQARRDSVHFDARGNPGRDPWRCSQRSTFLNWPFFSRGCVPPR